MASVEELDSEINDLHTRIANLQAQRANLSSILLSSPQLSMRLQQRSAQNDNLRANASKRVKKQVHRNQESTYRACAGVTAYKVKDPDPNAVDNGNVLGIRLEVFTDGKFVESYHVLLNRPSSLRKSHLKIHRHTIPPCIPIKTLADKYLPQTARDGATSTEQDLVKFGKILRKELISWHLRTAAAEKVRNDLGVTPETSRELVQEQTLSTKVLNAFTSDSEEDSDDEAIFIDQSGPVKVTAIEWDLAVRQITVTWTNGQIGVLKITKDGHVEKGAIRTRDKSRLYELERKVLGRIEELTAKLTT